MTEDFADHSTISGLPSIGDAEQGDKHQVWSTLTILSHPDMSRIGECAFLLGLARGRDVSISRNKPDFLPPHHRLGHPLADPYISRKPVMLVASDKGAVHLHVPPKGVVRVAGVAVDQMCVITRAEQEAGVTIELANRVTLLFHRRPHWNSNHIHIDGLVGNSAAIEHLREEIAYCAESEAPVLLLGETGTGKEVTSQAIYELSARRRGKFVAVNMGAVSASMAAAELFGAVRGAYTGSVRDRTGYFRTAHRGVLFLDEVGEMSPEIQVMLLRTLETDEVIPVGSETPLRIDTRVIAATDADLDAMIESGRFRAPLLYRLSGIEIRLPALRERRDDVGRLFRHFAREELAKIDQEDRLDKYDPYHPPWLPTRVAARLAACDWPGNVRQFRNVVRHLILENRDSSRLEITKTVERLLSRGPETLPPEVFAVNSDSTRVSGAQRDAPTLDGTEKPKKRKPADISRDEFLSACREHAWDLQAAAKQLGVSRASLYVLAGRYEVRMAGDLSAAEIEAAWLKSGENLERTAALLEVSARALKRRLKELGLIR